MPKGIIALINVFIEELYNIESEFCKVWFKLCTDALSEVNIFLLPFIFSFYYVNSSCTYYANVYKCMCGDD